MSFINVLVIGRNSLLSKSFKKYTKISNVKYISRKDIKKINFNNFSHVINFSIDPKYYSMDYNLTNKIDEKICKQIKNRNTIFIFPSSRLIYSKSLNNIYGRNKKKTENKIKQFQSKYLILRITTILTFDFSKRNLFISKALNCLKSHNKINVDIPRNTHKDFITINILIHILDKLIENNITGTYNISSNINIKEEDIFKNIIKGFGDGKIIYKKNSKKNHSFSINNDKLKKIIKFKLSKKDILEYCFKLGKQLNA